MQVNQRLALRPRGSVLPCIIFHWHRGGGGPAQYDGPFVQNKARRRYVGWLESDLVAGWGGGWRCLGAPVSVQKK